jgi:hypothetical protein
LIKNTAGESSNQGIEKRGESSEGENERKPGWGISLSVDNTSGKSSDGTSLMAKVSISLLGIPLTLF